MYCTVHAMNEACEQSCTFVFLGAEIEVLITRPKQAFRKGKSLENISSTGNRMCLEITMYRRKIAVIRVILEKSNC